MVLARGLLVQALFYWCLALKIYEEKYREFVWEDGLGDGEKSCEIWLFSHFGML